ncbi:hypothetical protein CEP54_006529 [Fusarium duplospermum]|uniref:Uncharacterized protein n=1 Tax=Fusarium duplospermum TaxID=1325734 RepID=A0A428Q6H6_9HYPO|nr:hypothetical protein CEP54_006529 [Fusarium duplospermum]
MGSVQEDTTSKNLVLTAQAIHNALPKMGMVTRTIHADDPSSPARVIEPPMQVAVNHRYHRDPELVHVILALLTPKRIFIDEGYHGDLDQLGSGDLLHIETPLSPTKEALNLEYYAAKAHQAGAYISIAATFTSPPLQGPLQFGVDIAMHS